MRQIVSKDLESGNLTFSFVIGSQDEIGMGAGFVDAARAAESPKEALGILHRFAKFLDGDKSVAIVEE
jgi:hypothetical protein